MVLIWNAKNYNAHRHNFVVNKHRQNSLKTFETFVKAANDDLETNSIFSSQASGYLSKENDSNSQNKFIEIIRKVVSSGKD